MQVNCAASQSNSQRYAFSVTLVLVLGMSLISFKAAAQASGSGGQHQGPAQRQPVNSGITPTGPNPFPPGGISIGPGQAVPWTGFSSPVDHIFFGGDKIWRADLPNGANLTMFCNLPTGEVATDVAVDRVHGNIFWSEHYSHTIKKASLNGCGSPSVFLQLAGSTYVDQMQIDVANQMLYWMDESALRIYRSTITNPSIQTLPPYPTDLWAFTLDLPTSSLYYVYDNTVYRANLNGSNLQALPNAIGRTYYGIAIDHCHQQIIAAGVSQAWNPLVPIIIRADLADAGNAATLLVDNPPGANANNLGWNPAKILLDPYRGLMYWVVPSDSGVTTIRGANINGTGPYKLATSTSSTGYFRGLAVDLANTNCVSARVTPAAAKPAPAKR